MENTYESKDNPAMGTVKIADDVVATIAALAATEIEGVSTMGGNITNELMNKVGVKNPGKGVKVEIIGKRVQVDLAVIVDYGYNIPATGQKIQLKVKQAIESMTGLNVTDVNLRITGVDKVV